MPITSEAVITAIPGKVLGGLAVRWPGSEWLDEHGTSIDDLLRKVANA